MKKLLLTSALVAACAGAFAQGKVNLFGDPSSLVTLSSTAGSYLAADAALAGQPVGNTTSLPSGATLIAGLWGGTSQSSLHLYSTYVMNNTAAGSQGLIGPLHIQLSSATAIDPAAATINGIASGTAIGATTPWFQVRVWDQSAGVGIGGYAAAVAANKYAGQGALFQMNPGPSLGYPNTAPPGANSSWTEGNIVISASATVPEPSTFALAGLGAAAMLIFRRRK